MKRYSMYNEYSMEVASKDETYEIVITNDKRYKETFIIDLEDMGSLFFSFYASSNNKKEYCDMYKPEKYFSVFTNKRYVTIIASYADEEDVIVIFRKGTPETAQLTSDIAEVLKQDGWDGVYSKNEYKFKSDEGVFLEMARAGMSNRIFLKITNPRGRVCRKELDYDTTALLCFVVEGQGDRVSGNFLDREETIMATDYNPEYDGVVIVAKEDNNSDMITATVSGAERKRFAESLSKIVYYQGGNK